MSETPKRDEYREFMLPYWCPDCEDEHDWDVGRGYTQLDRELAALADAALAEADEMVARYKAGFESQNMTIEEMEEFGKAHGLRALLDHLGLDGFGNEVSRLHREIAKYEWMVTTICEESRGTWTHLGTHDVLADLERRYAERTAP